jgi:CheY-like chemotaxis protein
VQIDETNSAPRRTGPTILVCDDEPSLRELVRAVLGPRYAFVEADDGPRALALARELRPDLIVLDLMLPGMSGIEVLDTLRNDAELASVPVIVVTAWSHAEASAMVAGADRFVPKPFDPQALETAVQELLP